ncbi:MAG: hypothetical protein ACREMG_06560, partial [Gemmatimonadales bacterium]
MMAAWLRRPAAALTWVARMALPYAVVAVRHQLDCLYILQIERYKPDRYGRWLLGHWRQVIPVLEIALQMLTVFSAPLLIAGLGVHWVFAYLLWLGTGHLILWRHRSLQVSQRLQHTARAVRVALVAFGMSGMLGAAYVWLVAASIPRLDLLARLSIGAIGAVAWVGIFGPGLVLLAAQVVVPVERRISRTFLGEADRRMRAYPGRVIGITGSYGKTTTKFITAAL